MPVFLVGGLGGTLETGRVLDYTDKGDDNRKLCSMYLSLMDRMGVKLDCFGDADASPLGRDPERRGGNNGQERATIEV